MNEVPDSGVPGDSGQQACGGCIYLIEFCIAARLREAGEVYDDVCIGRQALKRVRVPEITGHPLKAGPGLHLAAGCGPSEDLDRNTLLKQQR
ncbi:hypothetical protein HJO_16220 [Hyphomonas johnsonii MHS-2]|uniref:Uncharacterized protein n=1 Tax=Hyphomonas johnsonii MHS-2 TaxID=1280950 RepID=A0A059FBK9_9PROT|nr:hypothetical protein HJO_16220 [Hyphomonas johnsonii MHS-2]